MKGIAAVVCMLYLLLYSMSCFGATDEDAVSLTADVPTAHTLTIDTEHAVVAYDAYIDREFVVPRLDAFTLDIILECGYDVKQVLVNGADVTAQYADGRLTLSGIYETETLQILTEQTGAMIPVDTYKNVQPLTIAMWAKHDYESKTGVTPKDTDWLITEDGTLISTLLDENGKVLDVYIVEPVTATGTNRAGEICTLPQTGVTSMQNWLLLLAGICSSVCGLVLLKKSRIFDKQKTISS